MRASQVARLWAYGIAADLRAALTPGEILGAGATPHGADGLGCGLGCGVWTGGAPIWTPASLPLLAAWYEAVDVPATLVRAVQPTIVNGGFETGDATGWTGSDGGTMTASATAPYEGVYCGVLTGNHDSKGTNSATFIVGNRYHVTGVAASGAGVADPRMFFPGGTGWAWQGTTSTAWQTVDFEETAANTKLYLYNNDSALTGVVSTRWDSIAATNLSRTRWNPRAGSLGGYRSQATATAQFWASSTLLGAHFAVQYDGTADYDASSLTAASWNALHQSGAAVAFVFKPSASGAGTDTLYDTCNGTATNHGITIDYDTAAETLRLLVANGSGTFVVEESIAAAKGAAHYVELAWNATDGFSLRVDGGAASTGALVGAMSAADATATLNTGRKSGGTDFYAGLLGDLIVTLDATAAMAAQAGAWLKAEYGL